MRFIPHLIPANTEQASANWRKVEQALGTFLSFLVDNEYQARFVFDKNASPLALRLETKLKAASGWRVMQSWPLGGFTDVSADYTVTGNESVILVDSTSGNIAVTLPAAANSEGNRFTVIKKVALNTVAITAAAGENINGGALVSLTTAYSARDVISDGAAWYAF